MKLKRIILIFIGILVIVVAFKFYGYRILGIEKFVEKIESCVEYSNGGGKMIVSYEVLEFSEDYVTYCTENSLHVNSGYKKSFKYSRKDNYIYIKRSKEDYMLVYIDTLKVVGD